MSKIWGPVVLIIGLAIGAYIWGQCQFKAGVKQAEMKAANDSIDRVNDSLLAKVLALESKVKLDSIAHSKNLARVRKYSDSLLANLGPVSPEVKVVIDGLVNTIKVQDSSITFWTAVAFTRAMQRDSALALAAVYRGQRDVWQSQANPGLLKRLVKEAPWLALAYGLGVLTTK